MIKFPVVTGFPSGTPRSSCWSYQCLQWIPASLLCSPFIRHEPVLPPDDAVYLCAEAWSVTTLINRCLFTTCCVSFLSSSLSTFSKLHVEWSHTPSAFAFSQRSSCCQWNFESTIWNKNTSISYIHFTHILWSFTFFITSNAWKNCL